MQADIARPLVSPLLVEPDFVLPKNVPRVRFTEPVNRQPN